MAARWLSGLVLLVAVLGSRGAPHGGSSWSYTGDTGVSHWATLFPDYCAGSSQSPIDIVGPTFDAALQADPLQLTGFDVAATGFNWTLSNNGHSAQVDLGGGAYTTSGGGMPGTYNAAQFHFHWGSNSNQGSEHKVAGAAFPLEMHIVHISDRFTTVDQGAADPTGLAVLGVLFTIGAQDNPKLTPIINALASVTQDGSSTTVDPIALTDLLPANTQAFYRYSGSLTTPQCNEAVVWTLFDEHVEISEAQVAAFRNLVHGGHPLVDNFRSTQPLNSRVISSSFQAAGTGEAALEATGELAHGENVTGEPGPGAEVPCHPEHGPPEPAEPAEPVNGEHAQGEPCHEAHGEHVHGEHAHGEHAHGEHAHGEHTQGEHAHGEHAQGEHAHGEHAHGDHAHGEHPPCDAAHGDHAHGEHANGEHAHGEHAHGEHAHGEHAPCDAAHGEHVHEEHAHGDNGQGEHAAEGQASEGQAQDGEGAEPGPKTTPPTVEEED